MEIDRLKGLQANPEKYASLNVPARGTLKIANLVIPLRKEFVELRAKGKGESLLLNKISFVITFPLFVVSSKVLLYLPSHQRTVRLRVRSAGHLKDRRQGKPGVQL